MFFMSKLQHLSSFKIFENSQIARFNTQFQPLYDRLKGQGVDDKVIKGIQGRLFGARQVLQKLNMEHDFLDAQDLNQVSSLFNQLADVQRGQRGQTQKPQLQGNDALRNLFHRKYQTMIMNIAKSENVNIEDAKALATKIANLRLAIESQGRSEDLQNATTLEQANDILHRVELVSKANDWADLAHSGFRAELKERLEEFADILVDYTDYDSFKDVFMKKSIKFKNADMFFDAFKKHVAGEKDDFDEVIEKINAQPGIEVEQVLENQILAWVYTYEASHAIGSTSWCISYSESQFNSYVFNEMRKQYFVWDFDYGPTDNKSYVGITLNEDGSIRNAHLKNDNDGKSHVKNRSWEKNMQPLSQAQLISWLKFIRESGKDYPNWKTAALIHAELGEVEEFNSVITQHSKQVVEANDFVKKLIRMLIENDEIEMVKTLVEIDPGIAVIYYGMPLQLAYDKGNAELFNYLKSKVRRPTLIAAEKLAKKNKDFNNFLDLYKKKL